MAASRVMTCSTLGSAGSHSHLYTPDQTCPSLLSDGDVEDFRPGKLKSNSPQITTRLYQELAFVKLSQCVEE